MINDLMSILKSHRFNFESEEDLQAGIAAVLDSSGIPYAREVRLSRRDRIGLLVGDIAIEVKIKASISDLIRQLHRYAQSETVQTMILVTAQSRHAFPKYMNRKRLFVVALEGVL